MTTNINKQETEIVVVTPMTISYPKENSDTQPAHSINDNKKTCDNPSRSGENAGDGTAAEEHYLTGTPLYTCVISLIAIAFFMSLDQTIIATILPAISGSNGHSHGAGFGNFGKASWVTAAFMLPMAVLAMPWARIAQVVGRKYALLAAVAWFIVGSLICALAKSMDMLVGGRAVAGVGGAGIQVLVLLILTEIVPVQRRGALQGLLAGTSGIAAILGPLVGGAFTTYATWRWAFYINLPVGGIAFLCLAVFFNPPRPRGESLYERLKTIDYTGIFLLTTSLILALLALTLGSSGEANWGSAIVISFFVVGGTLIVTFLVWNFVIASRPLLPPCVVCVPGVWTAALAFFCFTSSFICYNLFTPVYFQVVAGKTAFRAGIHLLPSIVPGIVVSVVSGLLISAWGRPKPLLLAGSAMAAVGYGMQARFGLHTGNAEWIGYLVIFGFGSGMVAQSCIILAQLRAPPADGGVLVATAFASMLRQLGGVVGPTLGQTILSVVFASQLRAADAVPAAIKAQADELVNAPTNIYNLTADTNVREAVLACYLDGYRATVYFGTALMLASVVIGVFTTNARVPSRKKPSEKSNATKDLNDSKETV
jgi:MFS family permease